MLDRKRGPRSKLGRICACRWPFMLDRYVIFYAARQLAGARSLGTVSLIRTNLIPLDGSEAGVRAIP